ncbi:MAG: RidA family protein [Alphaproteobacteria bacterium]
MTAENDRRAGVRRRISTGSPFEKTVGYSRAVVQGEWCFVSGTTGYDYGTMKMPERVEDQTRNALATIATALDEAGFTMSDVVRVRYILTDRAFTSDVFGVLGEVFGEILPAATMMIAGLCEAEMKVEIDATAFRG